MEVVSGIQGVSGLVGTGGLHIPENMEYTVTFQYI